MTALDQPPPDLFAQLPPAFAEQLRQIGGPGTVEALLVRTQAIGLQNQASALFIQADRIEHTARRRAELDQLAATLAAAEGEVPPLVDAVAAAKAAERAAADRVDDAIENSRLAAEAEELARLDGAPPDVRTDALLRVGAARRVEDEERAAAEGVTGTRLHAEAVLDKAREVVRQGRAAVRAAAERAEAAAGEPAPISAYTVFLDLARVLAEKRSLNAEAADLVRFLVRDQAVSLGLDRHFAHAGRREAEAELKDKWDRSHALPRQGHVLPPNVVPGSAVAR